MRHLLLLIVATCLVAGCRPVRFQSGRQTHRPAVQENYEMVWQAALTVADRHFQVTEADRRRGLIKGLYPPPVPGHDTARAREQLTVVIRELPSPDGRRRHWLTEVTVEPWHDRWEGRTAERDPSVTHVWEDRTILMARSRQLRNEMDLERQRQLYFTRLALGEAGAVAPLVAPAGIPAAPDERPERLEPEATPAGPTP